MLEKAATIKLFWGKLFESAWFIPAVISIGYVILAGILLYIDERIEHKYWAWTSVLQIGTSGVRQVLSVTTGAVVSLIGVVFSLSMVVLTLAANQFGSKVLQNFLSNSKNKVVMGLLIGTFLFSLTLLAYIDTSQDSSQHTPVIAFITSLVLTVIAVVSILYFTHNISVSIQADQVISVIAEELNESVEKILLDIDEKPAISLESQQQRWASIRTLKAEKIYAHAAGYVEFIYIDRLVSIAKKENIYIEQLLRPGEFIIEHCPILIVYFYTQPVSDLVKAELQRCFSLGRKRTPFSDIEFSVVQLMQIALRALSPGINDSLTAIACIDWLSASLGQMAGKSFPFEYVADQNQTVRVKKKEFTFEGAADAMFNPLRQNVRDNEMVMIHLLEAIAQVLQVSQKKIYADVLLHHATLMLEAAKENFPNELDLEELVDRYELCQEIYQNKKLPGNISDL